MSTMTTEKPSRGKLVIIGTLIIVIIAAAMFWWNSRSSNEFDFETAAASPSALLIGGKSNGADWPSFGGTYDQTHFSQLTEINRDTVGRLGLVAQLDLPDTHNAGTVPIAIDGVVYFTVDQSIVRAYDVVKRELLWTFNPKVMEQDSPALRQGWGVRGIAWWDGRIYVGTTDGRLLAIDAKTGQEAWSVDTLDEKGFGYISGPPLAFNGLILIGFGGADYDPIRGYVTAYDAKTGQKIWRFHTVPGNPADGFENEAMEMAAKTWNGEWWRHGGGGTVWNAMTFDPELNLVYIGVGNGAPWNQAIRSPGGGDNLFLASMVALDANTGAYRWHYQVNPGETWDYTATMGMPLATVQINGKPRKVLMQAPKNGYFYVIDRETGELLSAEEFGKVTWAEGIDMKTGRPIEAPGIRYYETGKQVVIFPGNVGAHSWAPMAMDRETGLVFIPTNEIAGSFDSAGITPANYKYQKGKANLGINLVDGHVPPDAGSSFLQAWDPVAQKKVWSVPTPGILNGGTLATAGGIVFQGWNDGTFRAFDTQAGKELWKFNALMGISGAPITFKAGGRQYVAVIAGWGGTNAVMMGELAGQFGWQYRRSMNRLLIFALDGKEPLGPNPQPEPATPIDQPDLVLDPKRVAAGRVVFGDYCVACHGAGAVAGGQAPDLRASPILLDPDILRQVLVDGILQPSGMPAFKDLTPMQMDNLRYYVRDRARRAIQGKIQQDEGVVLPR